MKKEDSIPGVHLWLILHKATKAVENRARGHIESLGLCLSDFAVLEVLLHKGEMRVNQLGAKVLLTSGSITTAVHRLEKSGLVSRHPSQKDGRAIKVGLTAKGKRFIAARFQEHAAVMEQVAAPLSPSERTKLLSLLKKWGKSVPQE